VRDDEELLVTEIVDLASRFGRYGYRTVTGLLRLSGLACKQNLLAGMSTSQSNALLPPMSLKQS
jgi:hypothetical protein